MARSRITENQVVDTQFLSEFTFLTVDAGTKWYGFVAGNKMAVPV